MLGLRWHCVLLPHEGSRCQEPVRQNYHLFCSARNVKLHIKHTHTHTHIRQTCETELIIPAQHDQNANTNFPTMGSAQLGFFLFFLNLCIQGKQRKKKPCPHQSASLGSSSEGKIDQSCTVPGQSRQLVFEQRHA